MAKNHLLKVQTSLFSSDGIGSVMVYNEDKSIIGEFNLTSDLTKEITKKLNGKPKSFWFGHIDKNKMLVLDKEAPWQNW